MTPENAELLRESLNGALAALGFGVFMAVAAVYALGKRGLYPRGPFSAAFMLLFATSIAASFAAWAQTINMVWLLALAGIAAFVGVCAILAWAVVRVSEINAKNPRTQTTVINNGLPQQHLPRIGPREINRGTLLPVKRDTGG